MNNMTLLKSKAITTVEKRIKGFLDGYRQNIAILGKSKEQIKYIFENFIYEEKNRSLIYINVDISYIDAKDIFKNVSRSILNQYLNTQDSLDGLINTAAGVLPTTTDYIKIILKRKRLSFMDILELINKFITETNKKCIFAIEEFPELQDIFDKYHQDFSKFIMLQKKCMIILKSSSIREAKKALDSGLNLLFGNFETVLLGESSTIDNYLFFSSLLKPLRHDPCFIAFFINILSSNIEYYEVITKKIKELHSDSDKQILVKSIESLLYEKSSVIFQKFINRIELIKGKYPRDSRGLIKLLLFISEGYIRKGDIVSFSGLEKKRINSKLQRLLDTEYVENSGNLYRITDSLFSFWLSHVFKFYLSCPLDKKKRDNLFRKNMEEQISLFKEDFYKEKMQRILELFSAFKGDTIVIKKNRIKLPSLTRIKMVSYSEKKLNIIVGEGDEMLFAAVKENDTDETDISNFDNITKSIKTKNLRKIFISLGKLETQAELVAKENKVSLWDSNEINRILKIYNKPIML